MGRGKVLLTCDELYRKIPEEVWTPAYDADRNARDGADVAELTGIWT